MGNILEVSCDVCNPAASKSLDWLLKMLEMVVLTSVPPPAPRSWMHLKGLTGLCSIMETLFFCSIMLKSCRRSGAMFLSLWYSGLLSSTRSKYRSLWGAVVGGGAVTTPAPESPFIMGCPPVAGGKENWYLSNKQEISANKRLKVQKIPGCIWFNDEVLAWRRMDYDNNSLYICG